MFAVTRIYSDANGDTHFEERVVPLFDSGTVGRLSQPINTESVIFREVDPSYDWDFHTAPQRQFIILLDGEIEIETSLGTKRNFKGGDILLMEDVTGKGHKTKNLIPMTRKSIFIIIDEHTALFTGSTTSDLA